MISKTVNDDRVTEYTFEETNSSKFIEMCKKSSGQRLNVEKNSKGK